MARSLSQSKRLADLVSDGLSLRLHRRGFAAPVSDHVSVSAGFGRSGSRSGVVGKIEDTTSSASGQSTEASSAWGPDPVTGYYRPNNHTSDIDPAELREMLLNHKVRSPH